MNFGDINNKTIPLLFIATSHVEGSGSFCQFSFTSNMTPVDQSHSRLAALSVCIFVFYHVSLARSQSCSDVFAVSYQYNDFNGSIEASADTEYCSEPPKKQCCECSQAVYICDGLDAALSDFKQTRPNGSAIQFSVTLRSSSNGKLVLDLNSSYSFNIDYMQIQAIGGDVTINCSNGAGIIFKTGRQISLTGMKWYGCGTPVNTLAIDTDEYIGAVVFLSCNNVTISDVTFEKSRGSGLLIGLKQLFGQDDTSFVYRITSSHFHSNTMLPEYGGGVLMHVDIVQYQPMFLFENCTFFDNTADYGGGIYIEGPRSGYDMCTEPHVIFKNCLFEKNTATTTGGAVYVKSYTTLFTNQCKFFNNTAQISAAAMSIDLSDLFLSCSNNVTTIDSCHFEGNHAQESSAVMIVNTRRHKNYSVVIENTQFVLNSVERILYGSEATSCAVRVEKISTYVMDTSFSNSIGAGICMANANITIGGSVFFENNQGYFGGGMFLAGGAVIFLSQRSNLYFSNNKAIYGGAITGWSPANSTCIFSFSNDISSSTVWFVNNTASIAGDSIYINSPSDSCRRTDFENGNFTFTPNNNSTIASGVQQVQVLQNVLDIIPGQSIPVEAEVLDFYQNPSSAEINAYISGSSSDYALEGVSEFSIENGTTLSSFYVTGPNQPSQVTLNLVATTDTALNLRIINNVTLNIKRCSLGFTYNPDIGKCQCTNASTDVVACNIESGQACIRKQFWIGIRDNTTIYTQCTSSSCDKINNTCHYCNISNDDDEYCDLTGLASFKCPGNRTGPICAACANNFSFSYAAVECVSTENCNVGKQVIVPILVIIYLVINVCLLILFLKLDYHISTGYMFSFIYYFSIVGYFLPINIHSSRPLLILVSVFESITQLNPQFLAYVPLCVPELSALWHQALLYLNPLVISVVVVIFILVAKICSRYIRFSDSTPVRAICLLLLLSFTAFNETSISILGYVRFTGLNDYFVAIQPKTIYFHEEHIGLFIIAVAIEVFLIIPFMLFLFLSPFLVRYINFNKLKPFLDEFQGCYKDNFRWMAAFYFFCRQIYLFLIILVNVNESLTAYILQFTSLFILVFHMLLRPYRDDWLNLVDTVFLANLLCISLLYGETAEVVFASKTGTIIRMLFTYILILIPIIYFIGVVVVALFRKFPNATERILYVILCKSCWAKESDDDVDLVSSYTHIRKPSQESVRNFREPLLSDAFDEESDRTNGRRSRRSTRNISFISRRDRSRPTASYSVVELPAPIVESSRDTLIKSGRSSSQTWQAEGTTAGTQETIGNEDL